MPSRLRAGSGEGGLAILGAMADDETGARAAFAAAADDLGASPLYRLLCRRVADDVLYEDERTFQYFVREGASFTAGEDAHQVLTAVTYLLREREGRDQLAEYYPVLGGRRPPDERAFQLFREVLRDRRSRLALWLSRPVTLDDPAGGIRVMGLLADYLAAAYADPVPIDLTCVGAAAGLELVADLITPGLLEGHQVVRRLGVDRVPIDVRSREELDWMLSVLLPEDLAGQDRIRQAARLVESGDVILTRRDAFEAAADPIRDDAVPVLFGVSFLCDVDDPSRLDAVLRRRAGDVIWVSDESARVMAQLGMGESLAGVAPATRVTRLSHYRDGEVVSIQQRVAGA